VGYPISVTANEIGWTQNFTKVQKTKKEFILQAPALQLPPVLTHL